MEMLNQPLNGQLGDRLVELLDSTGYQTLDIVVAFAKNSGVLRIKEALENFRRRGGIVNVYVGVDLGGTSYEALTALLLHSDSLRVVHAEQGQTFHSKIYYFRGSENSLIIVGSNNLTGGGLWTNFESAVVIPICRSRGSGAELQEEMESYIEKLKSLRDLSKPIVTQFDIDELLEGGYILKEVTERVCLANSIQQDRRGSNLFGTGVPASLPRVATSNHVPENSRPTTSISFRQGDEGQTIWFETRSMTGGSRNILDLSMKSLIERGETTDTPFELETQGFMRGGVEFFGLKPTATEETKEITINFEGVDYENNTIKFPQGAKANGTWRLQIKGVSIHGERITEAFKAKNENDYLKHKIITFTKIQDDYYSMSVEPESELENFKAASKLLARNGSTQISKLLGFI